MRRAEVVVQLGFVDFALAGSLLGWLDCTYRFRLSLDQHFLPSLFPGSGWRHSGRVGLSPGGRIVTGRWSVSGNFRTHAGCHGKQLYSTWYLLTDGYNGCISHRLLVGSSNVDTIGGPNVSIIPTSYYLPVEPSCDNSLNCRVTF